MISRCPSRRCRSRCWQCGGSGRAQAPKRGIGNQLPSPPARRATNAAPAVSRSLGYRFSLGEISLGEETACVVGTAASIRLESVAEGGGLHARRGTEYLSEAHYGRIDLPPIWKGKPWQTCSRTPRKLHGSSLKRLAINYYHIWTSFLK